MDLKGRLLIKFSDNVQLIFRAGWITEFFYVKEDESKSKFFMKVLCLKRLKKVYINFPKAPVSGSKK